MTRRILPAALCILLLPCPASAKRTHHGSQTALHQRHGSHVKPRASTMRRSGVAARSNRSSLLRQRKTGAASHGRSLQEGRRRKEATVAGLLKRLYPEQAGARVRHVRGEKHNDITFGLEGELVTTKAVRILDWYRSENQPERTWDKMGDRQRLQVSGPSGLTKTSRAPAALVDKLSSERNRRGEFQTHPLGTLEQTLALVNRVEDHVGKSETSGRGRIWWQGNVAFKRDSDFVRQHKAQIMGYVKLTADYAQFGKLHQGYERHLKLPSFVPGANLLHGVLGPMSKTNVGQIRDELEAGGRRAVNDSSQHYLNGTFFRTWSYGRSRNGFEIRNPHKDLPLLKQELRRLTHGLQTGFTGYKRFSGLTMLDEAGCFARLSRPVQAMLGELFDYRTSMPKRFTLPLRPFEQEYPGLLGLRGADKARFVKRVKRARAGYLQTLEGLAARPDLRSNKEAYKKAVRVAVSKFAHETQLFPAIERSISGIIQRTIDRGLCGR